MTSKKKELSRAEVLEKFEAACSEAIDKRQANRKLREQYKSDRTLEATMRKHLVDDLLRVYNHPHNPFKGSSASRERYRKLGWYPEVCVVDLFGNHQEFLRAAGLMDSRTTTKVRNVTARVATERKIQLYAEQHVLPHRGKHDREYKRQRGVIAAVVLSDIHSKFRDPFAWQVALDVCEMLQPELIVLNGDIVDFPKVGRYTHMPGATNLGLQEEIDFTREEIFGELRRRHPKALMTWHIGNHEHRLVRYLADVAPALADLRCLQFDSLFGVDEYGIEMVFGGHFMAPKQKHRKNDVQRKTFKVYFDAWAVTHGKNIGATPALAEIRRFGISGTSGHTHRPQMMVQPTAVCPTATWMSTGMMASFSVGQHYVDGPSSWIMGFGVAMIDTERREVIQQPVLVHEHFAAYQGRTWRPTKAALEQRSKLWD